MPISRIRRSLLSSYCASLNNDTMALRPCPECRRKISQTAQKCPHCGFSFLDTDLADYRRVFVQRYLANQAINRISAKLHLVWLAIFAAVIGFAGWWYHS